MSKKIQLTIPTPCHENWENMTPEDKGRFCGSCQKQVVDFSAMSDRQIAEFFKKPSTGSVCGRFMTDQLDREISVPKKRIPWLKYFFQITIPAFLLSLKPGSSRALISKANIESAPADTTKLPPPVIMGMVALPPQTETGKIADGETGTPLQGVIISVDLGTTKYEFESNADGSFDFSNLKKLKIESISFSLKNYDTRKFTWKEFLNNTGREHQILLWKESFKMGKIAIANDQRPTLGEVVVCTPETKKDITGRVVDEAGNPLANVSILSGSPLNYLITDEDGKFRLPFSKIPGDKILNFSSIGFENKMLTIGKEYLKGKELLVTLSTKQIQEVVVSTNLLRSKAEVITIGMVSVSSNELTKKEPIPLITSVTSKKNQLHIFPNPVSVKANLNLDVKKLEEGYYRLQLVNANGQAVMNQEIWVDAEAGLLNIQLPSMAAGNYFVKLSNKKTEKKYEAILVVQ